MRALIALAALTAALASAPAMAQDPVADLLRGESNAPASDSEQDPIELGQTRDLNAANASANDSAEAEERARQAAFDDAQARYETERAEADRSQAQYQSDLRTAEESQARHALAMTDWHATVEACRRGDTARCRAGSLPARIDEPK